MNDNQLGSRCCRVSCLDIIVALLASLFLFALGLVLGIAFIETFIEALTVIIAAAAILLLLLIIFLILRWCNCRY